MKDASCSRCGKQVRISDDFKEMEWDVEDRTEKREGNFEVWICPFCHPKDDAEHGAGNGQKQ